MSAKKNQSILATRERTYEEEMKISPEEVLYSVSVSKALYFFLYALWVGAGILAGAGFWYLLRKVYYLPVYKYSLLIDVATFGPALLLALVRLPQLLRKVMTRYEFSRKRIQWQWWMGVTHVDFCDMVNVQDCRLLRLGALSSIKVMSKDKTHPEFWITFIPSTDAEKIVQFISAHAKSTVAEAISQRTHRG